MNNYLRTTLSLALLAASVTVSAQEVTLYSRPDFQGRSVTLRNDAANFQRFGFNDRVSSLRVRRGTWELCTDSDYRGRCRTFEPGDYATLGRANDSFSSARPVRARGDHRPRIVLFDNPNYTGKSMELDGRVDNFQRIGFNDRVDSIVVERGRWRLCSDADGRGECRDFGPGRHRLPPGLRSRVSSAYPR
jgi:hypothetical protein